MKNIFLSIALLHVSFALIAMDSNLRNPLVEGLSVGSLNALCYSKDGKKLFIGLENGETYICDTSAYSSWKQKSICGYGGAVTSIDTHPNNTELVIGEIGAPLNVWDLQTTSTCITLIEKIKDRLGALQYDAEGKLLLVSDESCDLLDTKSKKVAQHIIADRAARAQWNPTQSNEIAVVTHRGQGDVLMFYDVRMNKILNMIWPEERIHAVNYTNDGKRLVGTASWQFSVHDAQTKTAALLAYYDFKGKKLEDNKPYKYRTDIDAKPERAAACLTFLPNETNTFVAGFNEQLVFCDLDDDSNHARIMGGEYADDHIVAVATHPDGQTLAVASSFGQGRIHGYKNSVKIVDIQALKEKSGKWDRFALLN